MALPAENQPKRRGRPPTDRRAGNRPHAFQGYLTTAENSALDRLVDQRSTTRSEICRVALIEFFRNNGVEV